jgi:hypothetical protein
MKMTSIGLLPEDVVRKNIEKLIKLMGIKKELKNRVPANETQRVCLPIQKEAVNKEIRMVIRYLRKWRVNIKACIHNEN